MWRTAGRSAARLKDEIMKAEMKVKRAPDHRRSSVSRRAPRGLAGTREVIGRSAGSSMECARAPARRPQKQRSEGRASARPVILSGDEERSDVQKRVPPDEAVGPYSNPQRGYQLGRPDPVLPANRANVPTKQNHSHLMPATALFELHRVRRSHV